MHDQNCRGIQDVFLTGAMTHVTQIPFPADSQLHPLLARAHYFDAFTAELADPTLTPVEMIVRFGEAFPDWGEGLLSVRNQVVKRLGLRDVGAFRKAVPNPPATVSVGDPVGFFHIVAMDKTELVLGIDDSHLDVRVSVLKRGDGRGASYVLGSVVTIHNLLGRLYMLPVAPMHRLIVRETMRRAGI
jgi:hypothetical protein